MATYEFFLASSLEKVFLHQKPQACEQEAHLYTFANAKAAIQLVYFAKDCNFPQESLAQFDISVQGAPCEVKMYTVENMPSSMPCYEDADEQYLQTETGLFPDLLKPLNNACITPMPSQYQSLWLSFCQTNCKEGSYKITITAKMRETVSCLNGAVQQFAQADRHVYQWIVYLHVAKALLPQKLIHTQWFYTDCLAQYYHTKAFSKKHWQIIENFIASASEHGVNMLLTPVFTPPLDTGVGSKRLTTQLVDVVYENGQYTFSFDKLQTWVNLCKKYNIQYLEIAHFFTQWGAKYTPQIVAQVNGKSQQIFGWQVSATSREYKAFLQAFVPALQNFLQQKGFDKDHVYYHVSDEPIPENLQQYKDAKAQLENLLQDCQVIDAISHFEFYEQKIVQQPVVANDHIEPFLQANIDNLWVYYCCVQSNKVPNRFFSLPNTRNRIMGVLLYLYQIKGFLHWGFNFYNNQYSMQAVNPFVVTDCQKAFPSGDAFLVYPGEKGEPLTSLRAEVQDDALFDLRALETLEKKIGRAEVEKIIYKHTDVAPLTFKNYPITADFLENLRKDVVLKLM